MNILYLHGFASGPQSTKGVAFDKHFSTIGHHVERLNLRVPSFEHLRLSAMIDTVRAALDRLGRCVLVGSSLGGLTAARVAERDDRVRACVLMAPAFQLVTRWREQLGPDAWNEWQTRGTRVVDDYTTGAKSTVDFGFVQDIEKIDIGYPDVRVQTLVLHGTQDPVVPVQRAHAFAEGRPNVALIELDDGHELVASLPVLLAHTEAFLAGVVA